MEFIKYCKHEFNPLFGCNSIQLGTLKYFRELDPLLSITDKEEGFLNFYSVDHPSLLVQRNTAQNAYIFSLSTRDMSKEEAHTLFKGAYDSRYYVRNMNDFNALIGVQLAAQLQLSDFEDADQEWLSQFEIPLKHIRVHTYGKLVDYADFILIESGKHDTMWDFQNYVMSQFRKRKSYENEAEFRFLFIITDDQQRRLLSVRKEAKLLWFPLVIDWGCLSYEKAQVEDYMKKPIL